MPTYEFRCPKGHEFEKFYRSIGTAPSEVHCPECGALAERQLSGGAGLVFKGSGFYITDYGKDGKKDQKQAPAKATSASSSTDKSESTASTKSDSSSTTPAPSTSADSKSSGGSTESKPATPAPAAKPKDKK